MKNRKNAVALILSTSLATAGTAGLAVLATENCALAQSSHPSSVQIDTNTAHKEKDFWESLLSRIQPFTVTIGAAVGVFTYFSNASWNRRRYLEEKIKEFEGKIETINVRKMLATELQCIELFPFLEKPTYRFVIVEDYLWAEALLECKCNKTLKQEYEEIKKVKEDEKLFYEQVHAKKACIRDNFNRFLDDLQRFEKMIDAGVVDPKSLKNYLDPWFDFIDRANNEICVECPLSKKSYSPKKALLEYMGLSKKEEERSVVQADVTKLVLRFRPQLICSPSEQTSQAIQCETVSTLS